MAHLVLWETILLQFTALDPPPPRHSPRGGSGGSPSRAPPTPSPARPVSPPPERPPKVCASARKAAAGLHPPLLLSFSPLALSWGLVHPWWQRWPPAPTDGFASRAAGSMPSAVGSALLEPRHNGKQRRSQSGHGGTQHQRSGHGGGGPGVAPAPITAWAERRRAGHGSVGRGAVAAAAARGRGMVSAAHDGALLRWRKVTTGTPVLATCNTLTGCSRGCCRSSRVRTRCW